MPFTLQGLRSLRLAGTVTLIVSLGAAAALYWIFVVEQRQYLVSRNFRLLNTTASQTESTIRAVARIFEAVLNESGSDEQSADDEELSATSGDGGPATNRDPHWLQDLKADVPMLGQLDGVRLPEKLPAASNAASTYKWIWNPKDLRTGVPMLGPLDGLPRTRGAASPYKWIWNADQRLLLSVHWTDDRQKPQTMNVPLRLGPILDPIFAPKLAQGVFDTLALATADGRVLFAKGLRQQELQSTTLDALARRSHGKTPPIDFAKLARTSAMDEVEIAGGTYVLFVQPCCRSLTSTDSTESADRTAGLILVGLADARALSTSSSAISTTWIKLATAGVLLALVGWPFLKLWLIGERQRVRMLDVVQLGASSVFGVALLTIFMLDGYASWRTGRDVDVQLEELAGALKQNVTTEVGAASKQLRCSEALAHAPGRPSKQGNILAAEWFKCPANRVNEDVAHSYPYFESFALIDTNGQQQVKWAANHHVSSKVRVADREYFRRARDGRLWKTDTCPDGCFLESLWSWTTAKPQAVLSTPSVNGRVAALSIPMRSLMRTTLAPGFEFAVIDDGGTVLFHSDPQRNTYENLFQETDNSRRLRASVASHSAEPLNVRYWGSAYRAFVLPLDVPGWSVVTLFEKKRLGTLGLEWLAVTFVFLAIYMVLGATVIFTGLTPGADWIWPDERRRRQYLAVAAVSVAAIGVFLLAMRGYHGGALLAWAYTIPVAAWFVSYLILKTPPGRSGVSPAPEPLTEYFAAAVLLLVVTAVFPAVAFFLASYEVHAESYVKQTQLRVAHALQERTDALRDEYSEARGKGRKAALEGPNQTENVDIYYSFFYGTKVTSASMAPPPEDAPAENWLLTLFEEYLPYYAESSVEWRQLLHHKSHDDSWYSIPDDDRQILVVRGSDFAVESTLPALFGLDPMHDAEWHAGQRQAAAAPAYRVTSTVSLPRPSAPGQSADRAPAASNEDPTAHASIAPYLLPLLPVALVVLACGIVAFIRRHVFLSGLSEPFWARLRLPASAGDNLFVLCDADLKASEIKGTAPLKLGPIAAKADVEAEWRTVLLELDQREPSRAVVIDDFDEDLQNAPIMNRKLTLLEELMADPDRIVVVLSHLTTTALSNSLGSAPANGPGSSPRDRWKRLLTMFSKIDWRGLGGCAPVIAELNETPTPGEGWGRRAVRDLRSLWSRLGKNRRRTATAALNAEAGSDPFVRRVCLDIAESPLFTQGPITRTQILDEIAERASGFYRQIWASCSDDEKVVLVHIAQDGLANASSRRVVRRLLARRLLRKDPRVRVMNTTFRWFLLSSARRSEVMGLEGVSDPGTWNRLRVPLTVGVAVTAVFLFVTQKELFDATVTVATTMTVALPVLLRTVGIVAGRQAAGREEAARA